MADPRPHRSDATWITALPAARVVRGEIAAPAAVCIDSRAVVPGALFIAVPGLETDGHRFLKDALARGAATLLVQEDRHKVWEPIAGEAKAAIVAVPDTRRATAPAAAAFYDEPALKLGMIGVTGTDGKTTTVHLIAHVLESAGIPTGYLSSAAFRSTAGPARTNDSHMTTLEAPFVQEQLASMVDSGLRYAVIEASSHGLALHRVDACAFDVAVFTTLSRDHLDFHKTMEEYRDAKGRLFRMLDEARATAGVPKPGVTKAAVVNVDDPEAGYFLSQTHAPPMRYGIDSTADVRAEAIEPAGLGMRFRLVTAQGNADVSVAMAGRYNVYNCLAAATVALSQGVELGAIVPALESFPGVPGHLELIDEGQTFRVVIDIASTPEALGRVLETLRPATEGRLIAAFGCAGERDLARRSGMGRVAGELADFVVLTNEDPRREDPDAIIEEIAAALRAAGRTESDDFMRVPDRREAIRAAFSRAGAGDTVLLAGKGIEPSIVVGIESIPWNEAQVAREELGRLR
jgi:UDP-N-acetylmuramoyl-L-alanyl-D-glutamate--2,6-diaminopimelate ligase